MAHCELLKSFKNCEELKAASLKRSLSKSVFLFDFSVDLYFFLFYKLGEMLVCHYLGALGENRSFSTLCQEEEWVNQLQALLQSSKGQIVH